MTFVTLASVCVRVCGFCHISSAECRSVCVALVAGAGRRCTYAVCTTYLRNTGRARERDSLFVSRALR